MSRGSRLATVGRGHATARYKRLAATGLHHALDLGVVAGRTQGDRHLGLAAVTPEPAVASVESRDQLALFAGGFPALSLAVIGDTRRIGVGVVIDVPPFDRPVEGYLRPTISC